VRVERGEERQRLVDAQLVGEARLLQRDADALAQRALVLLPAAPEHLDLARAGLDQALEDLDRGGLARAVGAEQPEALALAHLEVQAAQRLDRRLRRIGLAQLAAADGGLHGARMIAWRPWPS
jgi:hypothetical protein